MIILTSSLNLYEKDELGNKVAQKFPNDNGVIDIFRKHIKKYENFLFVASLEFGGEVTENYARLTFESFSKTLPFDNYKILDGKTSSIAKQLIEEADFIFLSGGHLPTQNEFFNKINLKELLKDSKVLICGGSAGSMNCADVVYCPPELEGESLDKSFNRYLKGLSFTNINILPHYNNFDGFILDGKNYIEEIIMPDTHQTEVLAINDGSFVLVDNENKKSLLYGEGYIMSFGKITKINECGKVKDISYLENAIDIKINTHSSIKINNDVYIDPFNISENGVAKYIFITHSHFDHYSPEDIQKIITKDTVIVCPKSMMKEVEHYSNEKIFVEPNKSYELNNLKFETFASYNINKKFHPKENNFVGYNLFVNGQKVAIVGDSDNTSELRNVETDVLLIPIGGTYTMSLEDAIDATLSINPRLVIPTHYGSVVGEISLGKEFEKIIRDKVKCKILI